MLSGLKINLSSGDIKAANELSSSLRTALSSKVKSLNFSTLLASGAVKRNTAAENVIPKVFMDSSKDKSVVALK